VGVHVGAGIRYERGKDFIGDPESGRLKLVAEGRLYETQKYVRGMRVVEDVFRCARRFVSTHRLTVSSGTMLQALELGLPVLVPDGGLIGYRTKQFGLGLTYRYGDSQDLLEKWCSFRSAPLDSYREPIERFMQKFGQTSIEALFIQTLLRC